MAADSSILVSIHGRRVGLNSAGKLVADGRVINGQTAGGSQERVQPAPGALNATGALTTALIRGGIVTSSTAAAVVATLDTGTVTDAALTGDNAVAVDDSWEWSVINTGPNTFTVTAATGHTLVGAGAVATATSARFLTRKTAANTFVTYRIG